MNLPFFIARRYLLRQKGTFSSFIIRLAVLATAISVAVMILAVAFITGFKHTIREKLFTFWGQVHITPFNVNRSAIATPTPIRWNPALVQQLQALPEVRQVAPFALRPAIIKAGGTMEGIQLKGLTADYRFGPGMGLSGQPVSYADTAYSKDIILSRSTADRLELSVGDELQLYFLEPGATLPRIRKVRLSGLYHTGMDDVDRNFAICDLRLLQRINKWTPSDINGYQLDLHQPLMADTVANYIHRNLIEPPMTTSTISELYPSIFDWLGLQDVNARIILSIMAIVAIINLSVALLILMVEQARMVGVLKALGMSLGGLRQIFLSHAALIAGAGILLGNVLALAFCFLQDRYGLISLSESTYYMKQVPVRLYTWQVVAIDAVTLGLCILCMWLPTLYIRRIRPARVLQFK